METAVVCSGRKAPGFKWPVIADAEGAAFVCGGNEAEQ